MRRRFPSALRAVDEERLRDKVRNDDRHSIDFLAFARFTDEPIATAMRSCLRSGRRCDTE